MKKVIGSSKPVGHYTPGIISGNMLYISGQTSADPATGKVAEGGFEEEMRMALGKMEKILLDAGCKKESVVKCQIYLTSYDYWPQANAVYSEFFGDHKPARIILPVGKLSKGCHVELDAVAEVSEN